MEKIADGDVAVCAVVITYEPDSRTSQLLEALAPQVESLVVVDNGSAPAAATELAAGCERVGAQLIELDENTGIAHAQNVGIARAREIGATHVLLSDQDSLPNPGMVAALLAACADPNVAAAGPYIREAKPGGDELVYVDRTWGPRRANSDELAGGTVTAAFLLASGCLIPLRVLDEVGPMNEAYFIDHVDLEWCLRARKAGYRMVVPTQAVLHHSLGDATVKLPGRKQPVHVHGPLRCYYLSRNTIFLLGSGLLNWRWHIGYLIWLAKFSAYHSLLATQRTNRLRMLARGIRSGLAKRGGKYPGSRNLRPF